MITSRYLQPEDYPLLLTSLTADEYHPMVPLFFVEPETITLVYEDEKGPVMFVRGKGIDNNGIQTLQVDIQYVSNKDGKRNLKVMREGFPALAAKAKENGFSDIVFDSSVPALRKFCLKRLGFVEAVGQKLRYVVQ
jgi:hypothetical protein